jgi:hypothetical protein
MALPVVGFVCEGSTDVVVLRRVVEGVLGPIDPRTLQPQTDEIDRLLPGSRSGWSEVRAWCERTPMLDELFDPLIGDPLDLLVVAIDLDIAIHAGLEKEPANLKAYDAAALCRTVKEWMPQIDSRIVICIPVMAIESWILASLFPRLTHPEHERDPARLLVNRKKMMMGKNGPWKRVAEYRSFAASVLSNLSRVRKRCGEADRFVRKLEASRTALGIDPPL